MSTAPGLYRVGLYGPATAAGRGARRFTFDLNPRIVGLRWTTRLGVGNEQIDVGIADPARPDPVYGGTRHPIEARAYDHVEITEAAGPVTEGQVTTLATNGRFLDGFSALGYGLAATEDDLLPAGNDDLLELRAIAVDVLARYAPLLHLGMLDIPPGRRRTSDFAGMSPRQFLDALAKQGARETAAPIDSLVYAGRQITLGVRRTPAIPTYRLPPQRWTLDYESGASHLVVDYRDPVTNALGTLEIEDPAFEATYGFTRRRRLDAGRVDATTAADLGYAFLATHNAPLPGGSITLGLAAWVPLGSGGRRRAARIVAGEWLGFGTDPEAPVALVTKTAADANRGEIAITYGPPQRRSWRDTINRVVATTSAVRAGTHPISGARTRLS